MKLTAEDVPTLHSRDERAPVVAPRHLPSWWLVGQTIGVTRERVRQLEAQALNRLRQSSAHIILRDYLYEE